MYVLNGPIKEDIDVRDADFEILPDYTNESLGNALDVADFDGDGVADLLVGANGEYASDRAGRALVVLGPTQGSLQADDADLVLWGRNDQDLAGNDVAFVGDVDGDGHGDLLVGAPGDKVSGDLSGVAYLVHGPISGTYDLEDVGTLLLGEASNDQAGEQVAGPGDLDGDGLDDLLVGAAWHGSILAGQGVVYGLLGVPSGELSLADADLRISGDQPTTCMPEEIVGPGDVDGDGLDDVLFTGLEYGSEQDRRGLAWLMTGPISGSMTVASARATFASESWAVNWASAGAAGDVDRDGYADILLGADDAKDTTGAEVGAAYLILGPISGYHEPFPYDLALVGEGESSCTAAALTGAGDVQGNGHTEILVGALCADAPGHNSGAAWLFESAGLWE